MAAGELFRPSPATGGRLESAIPLIGFARKTGLPGIDPLQEIPSVTAAPRERPLTSYYVFLRELTWEEHHPRIRTWVGGGSEGRVMAGVCKACHSRAREEIDRALANGEPFRHIASRFRLSTTALQRHKKHVIALVRQVAQRRQDRIDLTNQEILEELTIQATYDPREFYNQWGALKDIRELPDRAAAAIRRVRSKDLYAGEGEQRSIVGRIDEIEWYDKHRALRTLAEIKGMLRPAEVQVNIHQQFFAD